MADQHISLLESRFYHLFNHAVGNEKLFLSRENYFFFLRKMKEYVLNVADVYAYSLLPNHFHLLIRIKSQEELELFFEKSKHRTFNNLQDDMPRFVMQQFSNFFNAYTKAFNKMFNRMGSLFVDYVKRTETNNDSGITGFIFYIHKNAVHHGLTKQIGDWEFDSYPTIIDNRPTSLKRDDVINWFGSLKAFIQFHQQQIDIKIKG